MLQYIVGHTIHNVATYTWNMVQNLTLYPYYTEKWSDQNQTNQSSHCGLGSVLMNIIHGQFQTRWEIYPPESIKAGHTTEV